MTSPSAATAPVKPIAERVNCLIRLGESPSWRPFAA